MAGENFDEDEMESLSVEEINADYARLTAALSPLDRFATRVGIAHSVTAAGRSVHAVSLGKYDVTREVARGGMGVVFEARDRELDRTVALKLWHVPSGSPDEKIRREAMNLARLNHPNVVVVHEVDRVGELVYMAMEYVKGCDLRERLRETLGWRETTWLLIEAGRGLAAAHLAGLVHGDFKPENVLVGADGRVRVVDFGVARALQVQPTKAEIRLRQLGIEDTPLPGTPAYMAPEQLAGECQDARSDQFSLCVSLWEALFGARPFSGSNEAALLAAIFVERPAISEPVIGIPERLVAVLRRGLAAQSADRFPSMESFLGALEDCLREPERESHRRRTRLTVVGSVIAGLMVGAGLMALARRPLPEPEPAAAAPALRAQPLSRETEQPPHANMAEVTHAFRMWQSSEPGHLSLAFASRGLELVTAMEHSALAFEAAGDHSSAAATLTLADIALRTVAQAYQQLARPREEIEVRNREIALLRQIERLSGADESEKIEAQTLRLDELDTSN